MQAEGRAFESHSLHQSESRAQSAVFLLVGGETRRCGPLKLGCAMLQNGLHCGGEFDAPTRDVIRTPEISVSFYGYFPTRGRRRRYGFRGVEDHPALSRMVRNLAESVSIEVTASFAPGPVRAPTERGTRLHLNIIALVPAAAGPSTEGLLHRPPAAVG